MEKLERLSGLKFKKIDNLKENSLNNAHKIIGGEPLITSHISQNTGVRLSDVVNYDTKSGPTMDSGGNKIDYSDRYTLYRDGISKLGNGSLLN